MFKRDNEQEDRYSQAHQPTHKMRGGINQYGQQYHPQYKNDGVHGPRDDFDAASARIRQFQQQQERMRQMQNSAKPQYQKPFPSPLSSIPEVQPKSSVITTSNSQAITPNKLTNPSVSLTSSSSFDRFNDPRTQKGQSNDKTIEDSTPTLSNVMEGLINVAETVVASKSQSNTENSGVQDLIPNETLQNDPSKYIFMLYS